MITQMKHHFVSEIAMPSREFKIGECVKNPTGEESLEGLRDSGQNLG